MYLIFFDLSTKFRAEFDACELKTEKQDFTVAVL